MNDRLNHHSSGVITSPALLTSGFQSDCDSPVSDDGCVGSSLLKEHQISTKSKRRLPKTAGRGWQETEAIRYIGRRRVFQGNAGLTCAAGVGSQPLADGDLDGIRRHALVFGQRNGRTLIATNGHLRAVDGLFDDLLGACPAVVKSGGTSSACRAA